MNLNKVFLIGRLTQDPEMRSTPSGQSVTTVKMATNRVWNDPSGRKEATEYHTVIAWGRLAEIASQYLKKGAMVMIEGRIQTRSWTDQANNKKYMTEIIAENLQLGPRPGNTPSGGGSYEREDFKPRPAPSNNFPKQAEKPSAPVEANADMDIPIIDENEPISQGMEEEEVKIKDEDLPF